jgi:hypothetical protein
MLGASLPSRDVSQIRPTLTPMIADARHNLPDNARSPPGRGGTIRMGMANGQPRSARMARRDLSVPRTGHCLARHRGSGQIQGHSSLRPAGNRARVRSLPGSDPTSHDQTTPFSITERDPEEKDRSMRNLGGKFDENRGRGPCPLTTNIPLVNEDCSTGVFCHLSFRGT